MNHKEFGKSFSFALQEEAYKRTEELLRDFVIQVLLEREKTMRYYDGQGSFTPEGEPTQQAPGLKEVCSQCKGCGKTVGENEPHNCQKKPTETVPMYKPQLDPAIEKALQTLRDSGYSPDEIYRAMKWMEAKA